MILLLWPFLHNTIFPLILGSIRNTIGRPNVGAIFLFIIAGLRFFHYGFCRTTETSMTFSRAPGDPTSTIYLL